MALSGKVLGLVLLAASQHSVQSLSLRSRNDEGTKLAEVQPGQKLADGQLQCIGAVVHDKEAKFDTKYVFTRRALADNDIQFTVHGAGICHSDIHQGRDEWRPATAAKYPMVPGHEITGIVTEVGKAVTKFKAGDRVGVGCFVDSCRDCKSCKKGMQQYCQGKGMVGTYNSTYRYEHTAEKMGALTQGGYSSHFVVDENYAVRVPEKLDLKKAAPLLCAGITTFSPLKHFKVAPGDRVAVAGCGGLGSMAVKFAKAMGAHVTILSRNDKKKDEACKILKADDFVPMDNAEAVTKVQNSFDLLVDTVAAPHEIKPYMDMVSGAGNGKYVILGIWTDGLKDINAVDLVGGRKTLCGSMIGGMDELQECLDFCAEHDINCESEMITIDKVQEAWDRTVKGDVKYRFVIDVPESYPTSA